MTNLQSGINLRNLKLTPYLGWPEAERLHQQTISLDLHIQFLEPPEACVTDDLADTYCYENLINLMKAQVNTQEFRLLEHVGYRIYETIKNALPDHAQIHIRIQKNPAITDLNGGVAFYYGDGHYAW